MFPLSQGSGSVCYLNYSASSYFSAIMCVCYLKSLFSLFLSVLMHLNPTCEPHPGPLGCLPVSVRVFDIHPESVHCQRNGGRHALQRGPVPGEGPLRQEELRLRPLPAPEPRLLQHRAGRAEVRGGWSPLRRRPGRLGRKLHLSVLRGDELFIQSVASNHNQTHLGLIGLLFAKQRPL